jgi:hypothetical protein
MDFSVIHNYRKLVRRNLADPITCPWCENEYELTLGEGDEPTFLCTRCNALVKIGLVLYNRMEQTVKEHL